MHDRLRGHGDEGGALVERHDLHTGRQGSVRVYLFDLRLDAGGHVVGVQGAVHHQDRRHHVVFAVAPGFAEPRRVSDVDPGDVLDLDRNAVELGEDDVLDVADVVALRQILGAAAVHQADAADVDGLLADVDRAAADIDVGIGDGVDDLGQGHVEGVELMEVDLDLVLLRGSAPRVDLHDARHREEAPLENPILDGAQVGQPEMGRSDHLITIDLADQARSENLWGDVVRQADVLLEIDRGLGEGEVVFDAVVEGDAYEGESVERRRTDVLDTGRRRQSDLHRNRVIALHFLGGQAGGLRGDLQDHRRGIRIGLDVQPEEGDEAAAHEHHENQKDDRPPRQSEREQAFDQERVSDRAGRRPGAPIGPSSVTAPRWSGRCSGRWHLRWRRVRPPEVLR